jgi:hypothetical protein
MEFVSMGTRSEAFLKYLQPPLPDSHLKTSQYLSLFNIANPNTTTTTTDLPQAHHPPNDFKKIKSITQMENPIAKGP